MKTPQVATAAGGTHPTGMHSCFIIKLNSTFYTHIYIRQVLADPFNVIRSNLIKLTN